MTFYKSVCTEYQKSGWSYILAFMDYFKVLCQYLDRLCGLMVRVPGYRFRDPEFDSRRYQIFWEVVGLERDPLILVSTTEEILGRKSSGSGLENREYGLEDPLRWPRDTLYPQKLALTSPTSGVNSVGIVHLRTKATDFFLPAFIQRKWALIRIGDLGATFICKSKVAGMILNKDLALLKRRYFFLPLKVVP
jgi:hypothetical protein